MARDLESSAVSSPHSWENTRLCPEGDIWDVPTAFTTETPSLPISRQERPVSGCTKWKKLGTDIIFEAFIPSIYMYLEMTTF